MFCPRCGQERLSEDTSFCSKCGFLLTAVADLLAKNGIPDQPVGASAVSQRTRGIRQGLFMFLLTFVIAPIVGLISQFGLGMEPWPVGVVIFGLGIGGLLRIAYAMMFEPKLIGSADAAGLSAAEHDKSFAPSPNIPRTGITQSQLYAASSRAQLETNDLSPPSVIDSTTKLLKKHKR